MRLACRSGGSTWGGVAAISSKLEPSEFAVSLSYEAGVCTAPEPVLGLLAVLGKLGSPGTLDGLQVPPPAG